MVSARRVVLGAVSGVLALGLCGAASSAPAAGQQVPLVFEKSIGDKKTTYNYWLYLPKGYVEKGEKKWPLIIFLHGMGERGNDVNKVKIHGIPKVAEKRDDFPFIAASPQCPGDSFWTKEVAGLNAFLDELIAKHSVDTDRVYLTGLSMGGYATWSWAIEHPERFAAIVPISGIGDEDRVCAIGRLPVWAFHGDKDEVVRVAAEQAAVDALKACGGDVRFTVYPGVGHDAWTATYADPELYRWLLQQRRPHAARETAR
jgi:predicted peptidase